MALAEQRLSDPAWWEGLDRVIAEEVQRNTDYPRSAVMPILQYVQTELGYLPAEVIEHVAKALGMTPAQVYGIASFYSFFSLQPRGKYMVNVCLGTACYVAGAAQVLQRFCELLDIRPGETSADRLFTVRPVRCLGCCSRAAAVMINDRVHSRVTVRQVPRIIEQYRREAEGAAAG